MRYRHSRRGQSGRHPAIKAALLIAGLLIASVAWAALPPPTPAQQQAAAEKKAKADAQAAQDKISLAASMDAVTTRWRARAGEQGWKTHPAVAVAAAAPVTPAGPAAQPAPGTLGAGAAAAPAAPAAAPAPPPVIPPIKSEKLGTAPPSEDVKAAPTKAEPRNQKPTVDKGTPDVKNK